MLIRCRRLIKLLALTILIRETTKFVYSARIRKNSAANPVAAPAITTPDPGGGFDKDNPETPITAVRLYINNKSSTDEYTYSKDETNKNMGTYEAKPGYGFDKVAIVPWCYRYDSFDRCILEVIWESDNPDIYAITVTRDGIGSCKRLENVEIKLNNSSVKKFKKGCCSSCFSSCLGSWSETTPGEEYVAVHN